MAAERPAHDYLCDLFFSALHALGRTGFGDALTVMNATGLTLPQIVALHLVQSQGPCTVGEIAAGTRLSPAATSHLVDRLCQKGLARRSEGESDRRQKRVSLSKAGRLTIDKLMRARREGFTRALSRLTDGARVRLSEALGQVLEELAGCDRERPGGLKE